MVALSTYLDNRPDLKDIAEAMIAAANELLSGDDLGSMRGDRVLLDLESSADKPALDVAIDRKTDSSDKSVAKSSKSKATEGQLTLL
jgi:hypothetical protein